MCQNRQMADINSLQLAPRLNFGIKDETPMNLAQKFTSIFWLLNMSARIFATAARTAVRSAAPRAFAVQAARPMSLLAKSVQTTAVKSTVRFHCVIFVKNRDPVPKRDMATSLDCSASPWLQDSRFWWYQGGRL